jgi:hypothetical protein
MPVYETRPGAESYGHQIGILLIDCRTPFVPGDVGNATTYRYPVLYHTVPGVTLERLILKGDESLRDDVVAAAKHLEARGVKGIASDCGFMIRFQRPVAAAVNVPVFLSAVLQIPWIAASLAPGKAIGVLTAHGERLTPELLEIAGVRPEHRVHVAGMEHHAAFRGPMLDETPLLDTEAIEGEIVAEAEALVARHPEIGALVLECSNMPPYAHAIQAATGRPVFDFTSLIDFFHAGQMRRRFEGHY